MFQDIEAKVKELSEYLDDEAIAVALKLTPEAVRDILEGNANIESINTQTENLERTPTIQVSSIKTAYRQRVISVCRAKGGVGATAIATTLANLLSKNIKVLLIDLNTALGGSDLAFYLTMPEYPSWEDFNRSLLECVIAYEPTLHVIQPPRHTRFSEPPIEKLLSYARQDYDVIIIDLPKEQYSWVEEAINLSNTLLVVTNGGIGELSRLAIGLRQYRNKEKFIVLNQHKKLKGLVEEAFQGERIWCIDTDSSVRESLEKGETPKLKSSFSKDLNQLAKAMFKEETKSFLESFLNR